MIELKEIKRDIEKLPEVAKQLQDFELSWLSHPKKNTKTRKKSALFEVMKQLPQKEQNHLNEKLVAFYSQFESLKSANFTKEKLHSISSALVEMKLSNFRNASLEKGQSAVETKREVYLKSKVLNDDFHSLGKVIDEVKNFHSNLESLENQYEEINALLYKQLVLEYSLKAMDAPHKKRLQAIKKSSHKRKELVRVMGRAFIDMQKMRKKPLKP
tara:strand:+ start:463 stop:1104 length:642 start_codon:yes stop_codon:yes gene_type:complete